MLWNIDLDTEKVVHGIYVEAETCQKIKNWSVVKLPVPYLSSVYFDDNHHPYKREKEDDFNINFRIS